MYPAAVTAAGYMHPAGFMAAGYIATVAAAGYHASATVEMYPEGYCSLFSSA